MPYKSDAHMFLEPSTPAEHHVSRVHNYIWLMGHQCNACKADPVQQSFDGSCHTLPCSIEVECGLFRSSSGEGVDGSSGGGLATVLSGSSGEVASQCNVPTKRD